MAHAQTNLDQGKSASQIFAALAPSATRHRAGWPKARIARALTDFLREHYTTSRDQAAALAAYVLGGRGASPLAAPAQGKEAGSGAGRASAEEAKPSKRGRSAAD